MPAQNTGFDVHVAEVETLRGEHDDQAVLCQAGTGFLKRYREGFDQLFKPNFGAKFVNIDDTNAHRASGVKSRFKTSLMPGGHLKDLLDTGCWRYSATPVAMRVRRNL